MNQVSEDRIKLRIEYSRETDLIFSDNIPAYADWLEKKLASIQQDVTSQRNQLIDFSNYCERAWNCTEIPVDVIDEYLEQK